MFLQIFSLRNQQIEHVACGWLQRLLLGSLKGESWQRPEDHPAQLEFSSFSRSVPLKLVQNADYKVTTNTIAPHMKPVGSRRHVLRDQHRKNLLLNFFL